MILCLSKKNMFRIMLKHTSNCAISMIISQISPIVTGGINKLIEYNSNKNRYLSGDTFMMITKTH